MLNLANVYSAHWNPWIPLGIGLSIAGAIALAALLIIIVVLKGYALWTAARHHHKWWFIVMLVINTLGILELIYLYFIAKKWHGNCDECDKACSDHCCKECCSHCKDCAQCHKCHGEHDHHSGNEEHKNDQQ